MPQEFFRDVAVSKTLMEAKLNLGSMYYESKILECPKNAIELTRLVKTINGLKKEQSRRFTELKRAQNTLRKSLPTFAYPEKAQSHSAPRRVSSGELCEDLRIHYSIPGFRYHANGEAKVPSQESISQLQLINPDKLIAKSSTSNNSASSASKILPIAHKSSSSTMNSKSWDSGQQSSMGLSEITDSRSIKKISEHTVAENSREKVSLSDHRASSIWLTKERRKVENILTEIDREIIGNSIELTSMRKKCKFSYLRAHSNDPIFIMKSLPADFINPFNDKNLRFSIKPGSNSFASKRGRKNSSRSTTSLYASKKPMKANCEACQQVSSYENFRSETKDLRRPTVRWKIAPQGKYVRAPISRENLIYLLNEKNNSPDSDIDLTLMRCASVPLIKTSKTSYATSESNPGQDKQLSRPTSAKSLTEFWKPYQYAENAKTRYMVSQFLTKMDTVSRNNKSINQNGMVA